MKSNKYIQDGNKKIELLFIVVLSTFIYISVSIYYLAFKQTSSNYSFTQKYNSYFGLEDWNLTKHVSVDLDSDDIKDMVTFTNCAFLSSVSEDKVPREKQCREPEMSIIGFSDGDVSVGQNLISAKPFRYNWLRKSYLVQTQSNVWKFYDINGLQVRTYELGKGQLFNEINPTILDKIDVFVYQISHFGIVLFLASTSK